MNTIKRTICTRIEVQFGLFVLFIFYIKYDQEKREPLRCTPACTIYEAYTSMISTNNIFQIT